MVFLKNLLNSLASRINLERLELVTVYIDISRADGKPRVSVSGSHTCYPAFELYIGKQRIYYKPPVDSSVGTATNCLGAGLNPPYQNTVSIINEVLQ